MWCESTYHTLKKNNNRANTCICACVCCVLGFEGCCCCGLNIPDIISVLSPLATQRIIGDNELFQSHSLENTHTQHRPYHQLFINQRMQTKLRPCTSPDYQPLLLHLLLLLSFSSSPLWSLRNSTSSFSHLLSPPLLSLSPLHTFPPFTPVSLFLFYFSLVFETMRLILRWFLLWM